MPSARYTPAAFDIVLRTRYVCFANERTTNGCPYEQNLINTVGASIARPLDFDDFLREDDILPYEKV